MNRTRRIKFNGSRLTDHGPRISPIDPRRGADGARAMFTKKANQYGIFKNAIAGDLNGAEARSCLFGYYTPSRVHYVKNRIFWRASKGHKKPRTGRGFLVFGACLDSRVNSKRDQNNQRDPCQNIQPDHGGKKRGYKRFNHQT